MSLHLIALELRKKIERYIAASVAGNEVDSESSDGGWVDRQVSEGATANLTPTDAVLERAIKVTTILNKVQFEVVHQTVSCWNNEMIGLSHHIKRELQSQRQREIKEWIQQSICREIE